MVFEQAWRQRHRRGINRPQEGAYDGSKGSTMGVFLLARCSAPRCSIPTRPISTTAFRSGEVGLVPFAWLSMSTQRRSLQNDVERRTRTTSLRCTTTSRTARDGESSAHTSSSTRCCTASRDVEQQVHV